MRALMASKWLAQHCAMVSCMVAGAVRGAARGGRCLVCASAQSPAAQRRLTLTGPSGWWRLERTVACSSKVGQSDLRAKNYIESRV